MLPHIAALNLAAVVLLQDDGERFRERVAPILEAHCLPCHGDVQARGRLSLEGRPALAELIVPGEPDESLLVQVVTGPEPEMPQDGEALSAEEVAELRAWIAAGGEWSEGAVSARHWWSLRPLAGVEPPQLPPDWQGFSRGPIDDYVLAELWSRGLHPSPPADRRTLLRRLWFDLVGLPPTPERVEEFVHDTSADAYEREVDRLLASPRYAERWARHWLDVVHYADTHGYDKDKPRPNAWPYRDWVIQALARDMPWAEFVEQQLAGDVLEGGAVEATGMLAAGPWDYVGQVELREGTVEKEKTRNLDRDDVVTNVFGAFQSLTVQCARCHDHKFDPIAQSEYYDLQSVFAGIERAEREYDRDPAVGRRRAALRRERERLQAERQAADQRLAARQDADERPATVELRRALAAARAEASPLDRSGSMGYHSALEPAPDVPKWVQVDLERAVAVEAVVAFPCDEVYGGHLGPGFGLPDVLELCFAEQAESGWETVAVWRRSEEPARHGDRPIRFALEGAHLARYVQVRAPRLWERTADYCFALAELEVVVEGENVALGRPVEALDSIEAGQRWGAARLVDGMRPWSERMARQAELEGAWAELRAELETDAERTERATVTARLEAIARELTALPAPARVYAAARSFPAQGAFTPPPGGEPRAVHRLARGEVTQALEPSLPGAVAALGHAPARFTLPVDADEGARRLALAHWITHPDNPLTWRSIANRVWQHHFGRGLVGSPSDFGRMGERPTHPELLDYLARRLRDQGGSLKALHREILLSATYRQACAPDGANAALDQSNRYLWRAERQRLDAETLRDSILSVAGDLDLGMGGPGFRLFGFEDDESPRYVYAAVDLGDPAILRRSVYRFVVRSVPDPWMTTFDCADPSTCTPLRSETTTPLQALALFNDELVLREAERLARRASDDSPDDPLGRAVELAWQRSPDANERALMEAHARAHGLAALCRVLLNANEFLYVD